MKLFKNKDKYFYIMLILLFISIILKMIYVYKVPYNISKHDLGEFINMDSTYNEILFSYGHIPYIEFLYKYHSFPPIYGGQYYHPPLFHILSAIIMAIFHHFNYDYISCLEIIQMFNMFISCIAMIFICLILNKLIKNKKMLLLGVLFILYYPVFYHLGASINNDCLSFTLSIIALYYCLCWYESLSYKHLIILSISLALSLFTKLSAIIVAMIIVLLIFHKLYLIIYKEKKYLEYKSLIYKQAFLFIILCLPISLFWYIRNKILFDLPFTYTLSFDKDNPMYIVDNSLFNRLSIPSLNSLLKPGLLNDPLNEANIFSSTRISAMFDQYILNHQGSMIYANLFKTLVLLGTIINVLLIIIMIKEILFKKDKYIYDYIFMILYVVSISLYINLCFKHPFTCTMSFRYITISLLPLAYYLSNNSFKFKYTYLLTLTILIIFSSLSSILYYLCAL